MSVIVHWHTAKISVENVLQKYYPGREHHSRGSYAQVWSWKEGVVKRQNYGDAYGDYVRWMIENQNNPYVPRLYRVDLWKRDKGMVIVYMEKLESIRNTSQSEKYHEIRNFILSDNDKSFLLRAPKSHQPHLLKLQKDIVRLGRKHCFDLHGENIMMRKIDENSYLPVLTDPIA